MSRNYILKCFIKFIVFMSVIQISGSLYALPKENVVDMLSKNTAAFNQLFSRNKKDKSFLMSVLRSRQGHYFPFETIDQSFRKDKELMMTAVNRSGSYLQYADTVLKKDRDIVLAAVENNGKALKFADDTFKKDREIVLAAVKNDGEVLKLADDLFKKDKDLVLLSIKSNHSSKFNDIYTYIHKDLADDKTIAIVFIENGGDFQQLPKQFRKNKELAMLAVNKDDRALEFVDKSLLSDKAFVLALVKHHGKHLKFASKALRNDREVVLAAIKSTGWALRYADARFRKDKEMILIAQKKNSDKSFIDRKAIFLKKMSRRYIHWDLKDVSPELQQDKEVVLAAIKKDKHALRYAAPILKKDPEVVLASIATRPIIDYAIPQSSSLEFADSALKQDRKFILTVVQKNGDAIEYADKRFLKDKAIMLAAINNFPYSFVIADETLKKDHDVVISVLKKNGFMLEYADITIRKNRDYVLTAVKQAGMALEFADDSLKKDKDLVLKAIKQDCRSLEYADDTLKKDKEVVLAAVSCFGDVLKYADISLKKDLVVLQAAVKKSPYAVNFADKSIINHKTIALDKNITGHFEFPESKVKPVSTGWKALDNNYVLEKITVPLTVPTDENINSLTFSPDGSLFATTHLESNKPLQINIWNTRDGSLYRTVKDMDHKMLDPYIGELSFTSDNRRLINITSGDGKDFIWNFADKRDPVYCVTGAYGHEKSAKFSNFFVTYADAPMHLWDMDTCSLITGIRGTARNENKDDFFMVIDENKALLISYFPMNLRRKSELLFFDRTSIDTLVDHTVIDNRGKVRIWELFLDKTNFVKSKHIVLNTTKEFLLLLQKEDQRGNPEVHISHWSYKQKKLLWESTLKGSTLDEIKYYVDQVNHHFYILDSPNFRIINLRNGQTVQNIKLAPDSIVYKKNIKAQDLPGLVNIHTGKVYNLNERSVINMRYMLESVRKKLAKNIRKTEIIKSGKEMLFVSFEKNLKMILWKIKPLSK